MRRPHHGPGLGPTLTSANDPNWIYVQELIEYSTFLEAHMHLLPRRFVVSAIALVLLGAAATAQPAGAFYDRDCSDFRTHRQAQHFFKKHNPSRDPHRLDGDHDGIACEDLP